MSRESPPEALTRDGTHDGDRALFLAQVSETMSTSLEAPATALELVRLLVPGLCDWATVTVLSDDDNPAHVAHAHRDADSVGDLETYLSGRSRAGRDEPSVQAAVLSGAPVQLTVFDERMTAGAHPTPQVRDAWARLDTRSCLFVPLRIRGRTVGVLSLATTGARPAHDADEIALAVEVARRAALALDNARLYSRQRRIAETLQRNLLTAPPQVDGLDIAVRYRPAGSATLVGGDFYDAFTAADGSTVLVVGDVSGHGLEAAAAMSQLRSAVRILAYDEPAGPAAVLSRVDRVLSGLGFPRLATVLIARVARPGPGGQALRWSSAGHPPPVLVYAGGSVRLLDTKPERLLGVDVLAARSDHDIVLLPGDTLLLHTDGLIEHRDATGRMGLDEGTATLTAALADLPGLAPDALLDRLLDRVLQGPTDDDVALLAVRCALDRPGPTP